MHYFILNLNKVLQTYNCRNSVFRECSCKALPSDAPYNSLNPESADVKFIDL